MKQVEIDKKFNSQEEYFLFEEKSELKHELINGNLFEMSGTSVEHNEISGNIYLLLRNLLKGTDWKVFFEAIKVKTPGGNFFYPDAVVSFANTQKYFTETPVLIAEVLSVSTRTYDLTDKFIQYKKFDTLEYYLCAEPEQQVLFFYFKNETGDWITEIFTKDESIIDLPKLNISFTVKDIYHP